MKFIDKIAICLILFSLLFFSAAAFAEPLVAIDPGHGGWDSGALGPTGLKEKDVNLDIGLRLDSLLKANGYRTIMTRRTDTALGPDLGSDLGGRVDIANNAGADIFISIHNNSSFSPSAGGSETYIYTNPSPNSRLLARLVQAKIAIEVGRYNRGVKSANFYVLRNTLMPAILVEGLFISNPSEEVMLNNPGVRQVLAQAIFEGVKEYFSIINVVETNVWSSNSNGGSLSDFQTVWSSGKGNWDNNASKLASGDFNGDGRDDLAVLYRYGGSRSRLWVFINNGTGGFKAPKVWWDSGPGNWDWAGSKLTSGNFNGDSKDDLAILYGYAAQRDVKAFVFPSDGTRFTGANEWWHAGPGNWDWAGSKLTSGNFAGDSKDDLAVLYGYAAQRDVKAFVFPSDGTKFIGANEWWHAGPGNWDWAGSKLTSGDFNGDNRDDLAILYGYAGARSRLWMFLGSNNRFNIPTPWWNSGAGSWDWARTKMVAGDFNGDNKSDLSGLY